MVQGAVSFVDRNGPAHGYAVLDRAHLTRITFNDPSLEQEVLQLFERQAELLMACIRKSPPAAIVMLAHTLKGSAVGIGADRVAQAAAAAELAASSAPTECDGAINRLESTRQGPRSQRCNVSGDGGWRLGANDYIEARVICDKVIPAILPMPKITYNDSSGAGRTVDAELGSTVMETAIRNNIPGIEAECGGACACATCHVYVDEAWREKVGGPSPMEEDMLDFGYDVRPNSRLSCQIKVTEDLDGLVVTTPDKQA